MNIYNEKYPAFQQAVPVWIKDKADEMNCQAVFAYEAGDLSRAVLHITGATFYRVFINGEFIAFGPARTAKGYARVDCIDLGKVCCTKQNTIIIEAMGYRCHTISTVNQPSFIQAEICRDEEVVAYTGKEFCGYLPQTRVQKVMRYSYQRHFCEVWDFKDHACLVDARCAAPIEPVDTALAYLPRVVGYPTYDDVDLDGYSSLGILDYDPLAKIRKKAYSVAFSSRWGEFGDDEIAHKPFHVLQRFKQQRISGPGTFPCTLSENQYAILDFEMIYAGFLKLRYHALSEAEIIVGFSEYSSPDTFQFTNMNALNVLQYMSPKDTTIEAMSFEPYTFRYAIIAVTKGAIELQGFGVKEFAHPGENAYRPSIKDMTLANIYEAAIRTFCHNAVDHYSDCPSRERSGWLCDSYFMAQAEYLLFGKSDVEQAFLENYVNYKNEGELPRGMLPMCYPADMPYDEKYIPQWAMWYVVELDQYLNTRNPSANREIFRESIFSLVDYFRKFENVYGMLEKLPGWNFIEWTGANNWSQDVNYPTNMLYAEVLDCITRIYGDDRYAKQAQKLRKTIESMSFNGEFFVDNAVRNEHGALVNTTNISEVCQYYAIRFGIASMDDPKYTYLKHVVLNVFGPERKEALQHIIKSNAFIGVYLRLEVLLILGEIDIMIDNIRSYFGPMYESTGTLWEYLQLNGSHDHGFASYAAVAIAKAVEKMTQSEDEVTL